MKMFEVQFVEDRNILVIPVFTLNGFTVEKIIERRTFDTQQFSKFGDFLKTLATSSTNLKGFPFPRWDYSIESDYTVEEMISIVMQVLNASTNLKANSPLLFTQPDQLPRKFLVARQIHEAITSREKFAAVTMFNKDYGFEVFGRVKSLTINDVEYTLLASVMRDESGKPKIYEYCSCPFHSSTENRFVCKHFLLAFTVFMKEFLGSLDYLLGSSADVSSHINMINNVMEAVISNNKGYLTDGLVYYIIKYLVNNGFIEKVMVDDKEKIANGVRWENDKLLQVDQSLVEKRNNVIVSKNTVVVQPVKKIVWNDEMNQMRIKIMKLMYDLNKRFGLDSLNNNDWSLMLVFAIIMASDYTKPPIVVHAIGDIGSFKTTGARVIAEYIEIPELVISYSGADAVNKYNELIKVISNFFGISGIENTIGGVITSVRILPNELKLSLNKTFLLSLAKRNKSDLDVFLDELRKNFQIEERTVKPKVFLLDPAQLNNIEDYRTKFIPSPIGLITQYDIFDNHLLIIDEGSRNPKGLETLLTRMSISTINEGNRIVIVTDNLEPFTEVMSNPRYAPLHDRTYKVFTSTIKNELSILQHFNEKPSIKFNQTDLLIVENFIDNIPVPEHILFLAKTLGYALGYKFSIGISNETKYLQLFNREENPPVTIDVFKDIEFKFIPGGRFVHHTLTLAKFIAFLRGHDYVTMEDFKKAIVMTIMSRTIIETKNYIEHKLSFIEILNKVKELLKDDSIIEEASSLSLAMQNNDPQLENIFKTIISKLFDHPFLAPAIASIIEIQLTKGINMKKLPKNMQYTIQEIMLQKGDISALDEHGNSEVIKRRKDIIKGE
jgi:hypothetical protein